MNALLQACSIGAVSLVVAAVHYRISGPHQTVPSSACRQADLKPPEICLEEIQRRWNGKVVWVDARSRTEWQADGIPGSMLWNLDPKEDASVFEAEMQQLQLRSEPPVIVVYCGEGNCGVSKQVVELIRKLDLSPEIHALHGGAGTLRAAGLLKGSSSGR